MNRSRVYKNLGLIAVSAFAPFIFMEVVADLWLTANSTFLVSVLVFSVVVSCAVSFWAGKNIGGSLCGRIG